MSLLAILGDALWIVVMSLIASASRAAWGRIAADARLPMQWDLKRRPVWRARRSLAFTVTIGVPLVFGLILSAAARAPDQTLDERLIVFLVRTATAPLFILIHFAWLRAALRAVEADGALKP